MRKVLTFLLLGTALVISAAEDLSPKEFCMETTQEILDLVGDKDMDKDVRWARIADVIDDSFDFQSMSQSVLATNWKKATISEREQFVEYFSDYLMSKYRVMIEAYDDQEIRYLSEEIKGDRAVVMTVIVLGTAEAPVNYKLKNNDGLWYAYDVEIEGVSLVNNYRNQYSAIAKNEGMDGLLTHVKSSLPTNEAIQN